MRLIVRFVILLVVTLLASCSCEDENIQDTKPCGVPFAIALDSFVYDIGFYPEGATEQAADIFKLKLDSDDPKVWEKYGFEYSFYFNISNVIDETLYVDFHNQQMIIEGDTLESENIDVERVTLAINQDTTILIRYVFSGDKIAPNTITSVAEGDSSNFRFANKITTSSESNDPCAETDWDLEAYEFEESKKQEPLTENQQFVVDIVIGVLSALLKAL